MHDVGKRPGDLRVRFDTHIHFPRSFTSIYVQRFGSNSNGVLPSILVFRIDLFCFFLSSHPLTGSLSSVFFFLRNKKMEMGHSPSRFTNQDRMVGSSKKKKKGVGGRDRRRQAREGFLRKSFRANEGIVSCASRKRR